MFKIFHDCPLSHFRSRPTKKVAQKWFGQPDGVPAGKMLMQDSSHTSKKVSTTNALHVVTAEDYANS